MDEIFIDIKEVGGKYSISNLGRAAEAAIAIRKSDKKRTDLAIQYNVACQSIDAVINRKSWRHI